MSMQLKAAESNEITQPAVEANANESITTNAMSLILPITIQDH